MVGGRAPRLRAAAALLLTACAAASAAAQDPTPPPAPAGAASGLTLEQLLSVDVQRVVGASRFNQAVVDAPASVTIVTREEIYTFGYRTLAEVIRGLSGFYVTSDRNYSYLGMRGFSRPGDYNTRVLLLVDGHRINDNVYDQALIGTEFPLDMDLVDRIEVIRGPASSLYGTSAFFGVINVITIRPSAAGRAFGAVDAGSQHTVGVRGGASHAFDSGAEALLSVTGYRTSGESRIVFPELAALTPTAGRSDGADADAFLNVFGTYRRGGWLAELVWGTRTKEIPTGAWETALGDARNRTTDDRGYLSVNYQKAWQGTSFTWKGAYDRYRYEGTYVEALPDGRPGPTPYGDTATATGGARKSRPRAR